MVQVSVNLFVVPVRLQQTPHGSHTFHPQDLSWHTSISRTLLLSFKLLYNNNYFLSFGHINGCHLGSFFKTAIFRHEGSPLLLILDELNLGHIST